MGLLSRAWQRDQHSDTGALHSPNTDIIWQTTAHYPTIPTMWHIDLWFRCSSSGRRSAHCICQQEIDKDRIRIRKDWTGTFGECVQMQYGQPRRIWLGVCGSNRSSASPANCKKRALMRAEGHCFCNCSDMTCKSNICAGKVNECCGHPIDSTRSRGIQQPGRASGYRNSLRRKVWFDSRGSKNAHKHWLSNAKADGCRQNGWPDQQAHIHNEVRT